MIEVYFLDILPSVDIVRSVADTGCKVYIMDHHKSAIPIVKEIVEAKKEVISKTVDPITGENDSVSSTVLVPRYPNVENHFTLGLSGCGIAWKFVSIMKNPTAPCVFLNPLVEFVQDRDLWNHNYEESNWILSYLSTHCRAVSHEIYMTELDKWSRDNGHYTIVNSTKPGTSSLLVNDHGAFLHHIPFQEFRNT
jgi:oligoribonuclease NrnB/cAMP/cGMP phosphodiesterase (DHH superfamily)